MRLKGGTLLYTLGVALVIGIISASFVLLAYNQLFIVTKLEVNDKLTRNVSSGINLFLADTDESYEYPKEIDLFGEGDDSITLVSSNWGLYRAVTCSAYSRGKKKEKTLLTGISFTHQDLPVLYISDKGEPIYIAGDTEIKGTAYLPRSGVKRSNIGGKNYNGSKLIFGNIETSTTNLPERSKNIVHIEQNNTFLTSATKVMSQQYDLNLDSIVNKDHELPILLTMDKATFIGTGAFLEGFIIISSKYPITIGPSAHIHGILIEAPSVTIESGFVGDLQVLATDSIIVMPNSILQYPSTLVLTNEMAQNSKIDLMEGSTLSGGIYASCTRCIWSSLNIADNVTVNGLIYARHGLSMQGRSNGSLYTSDVFLKDRSAAYKNHLLDAKMLPAHEQLNFSYPEILGTYDQKSIAKWISR